MAGHLVQPSRIPRWISKILFALGADEFLAMMEGKIRAELEMAYFFKVQSGKKKQCVLLVSNALKLNSGISHFPKKNTKIDFLKNRLCHILCTCWLKI